MSTEVTNLLNDFKWMCSDMSIVIQAMSQLNSKNHLRYDIDFLYVVTGLSMMQG